MNLASHRSAPASFTRSVPHPTAHRSGRRASRPRPRGMSRRRFTLLCLRPDIWNRTPPKRSRGALHTIGKPMAPSASQRTLTLRRTYEHGGMFTAAGIPRGACRCETEVSQDAPESVRSGSLRWRASAPPMLPSVRWKFACAIAARRWTLSRRRPQTSRGL